MGWCLMYTCWVGQEEVLGHPVCLSDFQILECLLASEDDNTSINLLASPGAAKCLLSPTLLGRFFLEMPHSPLFSTSRALRGSTCTLSIFFFPLTSFPSSHLLLWKPPWNDPQ